MTALRWCKQGKMPCAWSKTPSGTIIVSDGSPPSLMQERVTYTYSRVSSVNKKEDLSRQEERCVQFCATRGWEVTKSFKEVASGMNDNRKQLNKIFDLPPGRLVVEHKDRLTRFGFNYLEVLLTKLGWEIVVINRDFDNKDALLKDLVTIITSFCCRLYGLRRSQAKIRVIKEQCEEL